MFLESDSREKPANNENTIVCLLVPSTAQNATNSKSLHKKATRLGQ